MARELPISPLPIVLFPGAPQPLHVFEPRYRQLLADCLAADRRFGITYVAPPQAAGADPQPEIGDPGCIALIRSTERLADGRSNVLTVGERRFGLVAGGRGHPPYRTAPGEEVADEPAGPREAGAPAADVRRGLARPARAPGAVTDPG